MNTISAETAEFERLIENTQDAGPSIWSRLSKTISKAIAAYLRYRAIRITEAQLMALDSHTLKDIGLHRSEIKSLLMDQVPERRHSVRLTQFESRA